MRVARPRVLGHVLPVALVVILLRRSLPESIRYESLVASGRMHGRASVLLRPPYRATLLYSNRDRHHSFQIPFAAIRGCPRNARLT